MYRALYMKWARISGPSQETHTHSADRAQPSVTEDTDKALLLLPHASPQMKVGSGSQRPLLAQWPPHPPRPSLGRSCMVGRAPSHPFCLCASGHQETVCMLPTPPP